MTDGLTASDVALLSGNNGNNNGFGGDWGAWIILFLIFGMFGWGGYGGWGGGFSGGNGAMAAYATQADLQRGFDTQTIVGKLDGISNGICDSAYAVTNAVNNLGMNVMQGFSQAELSRCNQQAAIMQQLTTMMFNAQQCCCETQRAIDGVNYNMAKNTCDLQNTMNNNTRDVIEATHSDTRAILDFLVQSKLEEKDAQIAELQRAASQDRQNALLTTAITQQTSEIIRRLGADCPQPAYVVQPPQTVSFPLGCNGQLNVYGNGYGNGCGGCNGCGNC